MMGCHQPSERFSGLDHPLRLVRAGAAARRHRRPLRAPRGRPFRARCAGRRRAGLLERRHDRQPRHRLSGRSHQRRRHHRNERVLMETGDPAPPQGRPLPDRHQEPEPALLSGGAGRRLHLRLRPGRQGRRGQHGRGHDRGRDPGDDRFHRPHPGPGGRGAVRCRAGHDLPAGYARLRPLQQGVRQNFQGVALARTTVEARAVINTKIEMDAIAYSPRKVGRQK